MNPNQPVIHVHPDGNDRADGTASAPLASITAACARLQSGGRVIVHGGVYRDWIDPPRGGASAAQRLVIEAAEGETPVISGAETLGSWQALGDDCWECFVADDWFDGTNTLRSELGGDWFWHKRQPQPLADLFLNGAFMVVCSDRAAVAAREPWADAQDPTCTRLSWCIEPEETGCRIIAHFDGADPNEESVELSVREACCYPSRHGIHWVTLRGLEFRQAASPWAPPTAEQVGMVGPNWAKGWVIEDCHLHHARCSAISLGAPAFIGDNAWSRNGLKHGTQREREAVFTAVNNGWSRDSVGSHLIQRCHIHHCEQTGICGHLGAVFSEIRDNHIHHIHCLRRYGGHEMAGIKLHAPIDTRIHGNHIHDTVRGMWLDWQAQGSRVHGNLVHASATEDFYVEVSHGPLLVDHNYFLSSGSVKNCAQGSAFVHNVLGGSVVMQPIAIRYTPYHLPHSTAVMGLMTILGGDDRWLNNLFLAPADSGNSVTVEDENADLAKAGDQANPYGLACYDDWPTAADDWVPQGGVPAYAEARLPVWIAGNVFGPGTGPGRHGAQSPSFDGHLSLEVSQQDGRARVSWSGWEQVPPVARLEEDPLGFAFQAECPFEDPLGIPVDWDYDDSGLLRDDDTKPGPLAGSPDQQRSWPA